MDCQFLLHWPTKLFIYWQRMIQLSEFFQYSFWNGSVWFEPAESAVGRVVLLQLLSIHDGAVGVTNLDVMLLCTGGAFSCGEPKHQPLVCILEVGHPGITCEQPISCARYAWLHSSEWGGCTLECQIEGQACLFILHFLPTWPKLIWPYPFIFSGVIWQPVLSLSLTGQLKS